jgi:hypothetical protein
MKILHQVWKQLIWVWNEFQGYENMTNVMKPRMDLFRTIETIFVPRMEVFRTIETIFVPAWYKNSFNSTKQIHSCVSLFSWCTTWSTQYLFHNQKWVKICIVCHWLHRIQVAHHEWRNFVPLKLFLYQTGTKKVSMVRNPFESFASSDLKNWAGRFENDRHASGDTPEALKPEA